MTIQEIADRLVELNKEGNYKQAYEELYSPDVVSIENWGEREIYTGFDEIKAKGEKWEAGLEEMHSASVGTPIIADSSFAVTFSMDVTFNDSNGPEMAGRMQFTEIAVYRVKDGKIFHEEFFG
ncbi:MAG: nuclear transport factor 2 family protein [Patescibacteria group bacterium]